MLRFENLRLSGWRQFSAVEIQFGERLTVITGANGAGKSTILSLLIQHFGLSKGYLGTPTQNEGRTSFSTNVFTFFSKILKAIEAQYDPNNANVGRLSYSNGAATILIVPKSGAQSYQVSLSQAQPVIGFHMPSHRVMPNYQQVPNVVFGGVDPTEAFDRIYPEVSAHYLGSQTGSSTLFKLKEVLANWASYGDENSRLKGDPAQRAAFDGFIEILRLVLPSDLGFDDLEVLPPDIVMKTRTGDFLIDSLSGGLIALVEMVALIYTRKLRPDGQNGFVVTMDEPENHLHPAMQRAVLPALMRAFPDVQFIVATHSPFIVTSAPDANVYALRYEDIEIQDDPSKRDNSAAFVGRKVQGFALDMHSISSGTSEILRDVLGVGVTYPVWVEDKLEALVQKFEKEDFTKETIDKFKAELKEEGLANTLPGALIMLGKAHD